MRRREGNTEAVKRFVAAQGVVRKLQIQDSLGLTKEQTKTAVNTLVCQGFLRRIGYGSYEFIEPRVEIDEAPVQDKIWRAMLINPRFSLADLSRQAGTTTDYVRKVFRNYVADGLVASAGRRPTYGTGTEKIWRLTGKGRGHRERPRAEFRPDPLVLETVTLNKLICTGLAIRQEEYRRQAMTLCTDIRQRLEDWELQENKQEVNDGDNDSNCDPGTDLKSVPIRGGGVDLVLEGYRQEALIMLRGLQRQIIRTLEKPEGEITGRDLDMIAILAEVALKHTRRYCQVAGQNAGYADDGTGTLAA